jgi:perosamine synthetase
MISNRILVTGGTGLVGSALKEITDMRVGVSEQQVWIFVGSKDVDLTCSYSTELCFEKHQPTIVIHLAAVALGAQSTDADQFDSLITNIQINANVINQCKKSNIKRLFICSTALLYESVPNMETKNHFGYLHSKVHLQALCEGYRRSVIGSTVTELYVPNIYGYQEIVSLETAPRSGQSHYCSSNATMAVRLIPTLYKIAITAPLMVPKCSMFNMVKNYLYNYDFAHILVALINTGSSLPNRLLIGNPEKVRIDYAIKLIRDGIFGVHSHGLPVIMTNPEECIRLINHPYDDMSVYGYDENYTSFADGIIDMMKRVRSRMPTSCYTKKRNITLGHFKAMPATYKNIHDSLSSGQLSYGKYSKRLEQQFAEIHEVKHAILSNSGTSSLHVGIAALKEHYGWKDGQEILVPSTTFVASVNVIISNNLKPVLVDIEPEYYGMDPTKIEAKITDNTVGIMVVHLFGQPSDMDPIMSIAEKYNLRVIEDSCETMLAKYNGKSVGSIGDVAAFSTYVAHLITTGVGGLTTTNNPELAKLIRSLVNHGRNNIYITTKDDDNVADHELFKEIVKKRFQFERVGFSYRITELEAGLGVVELNMLSANIDIRRRNAQYLTNKLHFDGVDKYLKLPSVRPGSDHSYMIYALVVIDPRVQKQDLVMYLEDNGIETRDLMPITTQPVYTGKIKELNIQDVSDYTTSNRLNENGFYIGCHQHLCLDDMTYIAHIITVYFDTHGHALEVPPL